MGQDSILSEIQRLATDSKGDLGDLLRKCLIVATKLKLADFKKWIEAELHGYGKNEVPDYRKIRAQLKAKNPYRGLIPYVIEDVELANALTVRAVRQSIGDLEHLVTNASGPILSLSLPHSDMALLLRMQREEAPFALEPVMEIGVNQLAGILKVVRNKILEWALQLDEMGIKGDGLTFSTEEKEKAHLQSITQHIYGDMTMRDSYKAGQAGAQGPEAHAKHMTFDQIWQENAATLDLPVLATELSTLRKTMRERGTEAEHDESTGAVGAAEIAAKKGDGPGALENLKKAGKFALKTARDIGVDIAAKALVEAGKG